MESQTSQTARRSAEGAVALILRLAAVLLAVGSQVCVPILPWLSLFGFAAAMGLFLVAERLPSGVAEPIALADAPPASTPRTFWWLLGLGLGVCFLAGIAVYRGASPAVTHTVWLLGLALFLAAAARTWRRRRTPRRLGWQTLGALALLLVLSGVLFGWHLTSMPPEVHGDEAEVGNDAIYLLETERFNLFETGWFRLPRFHAVPTAIGLKLFGANLLGLRSTSVALGVATVLLLFVLARRLWGFEVALLAALLLASQRFFIHLSRAGYQYIDTAFLSVLVVWLFLRFWQDRRLASALWCGIALGLGVQTYYASRVVPLLLIITAVLWLVRTDRAEFRSRITGVVLIVIAALATAASMIGYFAHDTESLWLRMHDTTVFNQSAKEHLAQGYQTDSLTEILLIQTRAALTVFNATGDTSLQYGYGEPLLEPISAALFVLGIALACARLSQRRYQLLLLWTVIPLIAGAALTIDAPFYPRISGLLPFVALFVALPLQRLLSSARAALPGTMGRWVASLAAVSVLVVVFANNIRSYFVDYAPNHRHTPFVEMSSWIQEHGSGRTTYIIGGVPQFSAQHGTIRFLTQGHAVRDIADLPSYLDARELDPSESAFIILPRSKDALSQLRASLGPLQVRPQRDNRGHLIFYTALPTPTEPAQRAVRAHRSILPRDKPAGLYLHVTSFIGGVVLVAALMLGAVLAWRRQRSHGGAAPVVVLRQLRDWAATWQQRLFEWGRSDRRLAPPRLVTVVLLTVIIVGGAMARTYRLGDLPAGFFCDEAGLGYNAYSILRTGKDETGAVLPLYVWSFHVSYKNPIYVYSSMIPLAVFGPSEFALRLTSAFYGTATIVAMFFLGRALFGTWMGLLAALFLAVVPWHLHFSRIGFELITFPFFFVVGLTLLIRYAQGHRSLSPAMIMLGLCLYTYAPAKLFVPLFVIGFAVVYRHALLHRWRESIIAAILLGLTVAPVVIFDLRNADRAGRYLSGTTFLQSDKSLIDVPGEFVRNYVAFLSPSFLFERGDHMTRHAVRGHGELYPFFAPLLILGLVTVASRRDRTMTLILLWLGLYPIAPALMNEIPSASRGIIGVPVLCLLAAIGVGTILAWVAQISQRRVVAVSLQCAVLIGGSFFLIRQAHAYWDLYTQEYPRYSAKTYDGFQFGHRQVVQYFLDHYEEYDRLLLSSTNSNQPEIFLRFYGALHRPPSAGIPPFDHGRKMRVGTPEWLHEYTAAPRMLLAVLPEELPLFADYEVKETVVAPDGSPAYLLVDVKAPKDFVHNWWMVGPYPATDPPPVPNYDPDAPPTHGPRGQPWREYRKPTASVRPYEMYGPDHGPACTWAVNFLHTEQERDIQVLAGFDRRGEVWINGTEVPLRFRHNAHGVRIDSEVGTAALRPGRNTVAVKVCGEGDQWSFYFRLADTDGTVVDDVEWKYGSRKRRP